MSIHHYEKCLKCGQLVQHGFPCSCMMVSDAQKFPTQMPATLPPCIPIPQSRQHAAMMVMVAQRYLDDNPE